MDISQASSLIKQKAKEIGFAACGIAKAEPVDEKAIAEIEEWLSEGYAAGMDYMTKNKNLRYDPRELFPGARSLIVVAMNYYPQQIKESDITFSYYAYGKDYHFVVKNYLSLLFKYIEDAVYPELGLKEPLIGRAFTDSAPLMERYWAKKAGVGFQGRNQLIIVPRVGSFCFLGVLAVNLELVADAPLQISCGSCNRCVKACPTNALCGVMVDSNKCISYQTIENRANDIPEDIGSMMGTKIYGCDVCQLACPWNRFAKPTDIAELLPTKEFLSLDSEQLKNMGSGEFKRMFKGSAIVRAGLKGLKRNLFSVKNTIDESNCRV